MNDITHKRAQRVIERQVADGSMIRLGDGQIVERDRLAQQTASQAVIMTSTTGHGAHVIAIWCDRCASRYSISGPLIASPLFLCGGPTTQPGPSAALVTSPMRLCPADGRGERPDGAPTPHRRRGSSRVLKQSKAEPPRHAPRNRAEWEIFGSHWSKGEQRSDQPDA